MVGIAIGTINSSQIGEINICANVTEYLKEANLKGVTMIYNAGLTKGSIKILKDIDHSNMHIGNAYLVGGEDDYDDLPYNDVSKEDMDINWYFGGAKLISDGSNQGLTGYQSKPYCCVPGDYGIFDFLLDDDKNVVRQLNPPNITTPIDFSYLVTKIIISKKWPLMIHANGDQAVKYTIQAYKNTESVQHDDFRNRIEHCSLLDSEDLKEIQRLSLTPSFLIGHVGYWGYAFQQNIFGLNRVNKLDLCKSALDENIRISLHSDNPVTPLGPLRMMEQSITRIMESDPNGSVLNKNECLTPEQALIAVTYDAAWQCHAEHLVGSLKPGNLADFVILAENPLTMEDPYMKMRDIGVEQVWIGGKQIISKPTDHLFILKEKGKNREDTDNAQVLNVNSNGTIGNKISGYNWTPGWSTASFYTINGHTYLFILKEKGRDSGHTDNAQVLNVNSNGTIGNKISGYNWTEGWSTASFYTINGHTYLFILKEKGKNREDTDNAQVLNVNSNGTIGEYKIKGYNWTEGWTQAVPFTSGGTQYLFLLKEGTGDVHIHKLNDDGTVGSKVVEYNWTPGWSTASFYTINGHTYLFILKKDDGAVHIQQMNSDGKVGFRVASLNWTEGWTQAVPFTSGCTQYLFLLKEGTGDVHIHKLNDDGTVGSKVVEYNWTPGWSTASFFR